MKQNILIKCNEIYKFWKRIEWMLILLELVVIAVLIPIFVLLSVFDQLWLNICLPIFIIAGIALMKNIFFIIPSRVSYWEYRKNVLDEIKKYDVENDYEKHCFNSYINSNFKKSGYSKKIDLPFNIFQVFFDNFIFVISIISDWNLGKLFSGPIRVVCLALTFIIPFIPSIEKSTLGSKSLLSICLLYEYATQNFKEFIDSTNNNKTNFQTVWLSMSGSNSGLENNFQWQINSFKEKWN